MSFSLPHFNTLQRWYSYLFSISVKKWESNGEQLELDYFKGEFRLSTADTFYSNGMKYRPFYYAYQYLQEQHRLGQLKNVLVLGGGLAANVLMWAQFGGFDGRQFTIVEFDESIATVADAIIKHTNPAIHYQIHVADAYAYVNNETATYDLINLDVFINSVVPDQFCSAAFLQSLHELLNENGTLIMNYMVHNAGKWERLQQNLHHIFSHVHIIDHSPNRFIICQK